MSATLPFQTWDFATKKPRGELIEFEESGLSLTSSKRNLMDVRKSGLKPVLSVPNGWATITHNVWPHDDKFGHCLVYCHAGDGSLFVVHDGALHAHRLRAGFAVLFDDYENHFVMAVKPMVIFCCGVEL